jgi:N-acetyl-alpha-D-muramate 1-phosphate uridylyltransferase
MQCIILAGGLGTRLGSRTVDKPKAMVAVAGEPFLRHQLRQLQNGGVNDVVICIGYRGLLIEDEIARHCPLGMSVRCISDGDRLRGTAGAIRRVVERGYTDERFMVLHGDSYILANLADVWRSFDSTNYLGLMTVWRGDVLEDCNAGVRDGKVMVFRRGESHSNHPSMNHVDCGLGVVEADTLLDLVPPGVPYDLADMYESLAAQGRLQAYELDERFHEIGSATGLAALDRLLTLQIQR